MNRWHLAGALLSLMCVSQQTVTAAGLTHGPIVGHTTDHSTRIWVRTDGRAELRVRLRASDGRQFLSAAVVLKQEDNFCGTAEIEGLAPATTYAYRVLVDRVEQPPQRDQRVTTFPPANQPARLRIGFGHSIRGPGKQTTWLAIADKKPDLFILMGDNIYSNTTEPAKHRKMYLQARADPCFAAFAANTPIYATWDDHDYGTNNSDRTQPGRERSLKTFNEIWPNPPSQARRTPGIWTRLTLGQAEFFLLDVRYHRAPDDAPDGPDKTMLGLEQRDWLLRSLRQSNAVLKFLVSGSSWNCGGVESWNHRFLQEYDTILASLRHDRVTGVVLLGGDQHECKIAVRPAESWGGYDLHEWMAGQVWNRENAQQHRGFGLITVDTTTSPATAELQFFDQHGQSRDGKRILYTTPGALRALWNSPPGAMASPPRAVDGELRPASGPLWNALPSTSGETLTVPTVGSAIGAEMDDAVAWLEKESQRMIRACRREMADGTAAFPPQVGIGYEAFWLRDYAYMIEGYIEGFSDKELRDACLVFVNAQRADGACVDCVKYDGTPIYKPGYGSMGANPVADGSQFTVDVAWHTHRRLQDKKLLGQIIERLIKGMHAVPRNPETGLVHISSEALFDRCPYGFTDTVRKQGDVLFSSLLFVQASRQLAELLGVVDRADASRHWNDEADRVTAKIRDVFWDPQFGLFRAATAKCREHDIWGSAFAVYLNVATQQQALTIARYFKTHYSEIVQKGQIRHLPGGVYWEQARRRDHYQNGAYWATPTGWFVDTLDLVDRKLADQTVIDLVNDFRQRGCLEWCFGKTAQLPNYLASGTNPLAGIRKMRKRRDKTFEP